MDRHDRSSVLHSGMAMGRRRERARTPELWIAAHELPATGGHPFYQRLNHVLDTHGFRRVRRSPMCRVLRHNDRPPESDAGHVFPAAADRLRRRIDSERGIAWRTADSLALRGFLGLGLEEATPEHSTISRTRRLIDLETHRAVFTWILQVLAAADLIKGKTLRSIVRRDSGETYQEFLTRLAQASGIETPTRADLARLDRKRPKKRPQQGLAASARPRRTDHEDEGRSHAPGAQGRTRRRHGDRCDRERDGARRRSGRYDHDGGDGHGRG